MASDGHTGEADASLIRAEARQGAFFFDAEVEQKLEHLDSRGSSTGERIFFKNRKLYDTVLKLSALGYSGRAISEIVSIDTATVQSIISREPGAIQSFQKVISAKWRKIADMSAERLIEEMDRIPIAQLPMTAAIATDKANAVTDLSDSSESVSDEKLEDINDAISRLPSKTLGDVIDVDCSGVVDGEGKEKGDENNGRDANA